MNAQPIEVDRSHSASRYRRVADSNEYACPDTVIPVSSTSTSLDMGLDHSGWPRADDPEVTPCWIRTQPVDIVRFGVLGNGLTVEVRKDRDSCLIGRV